MMRLSEAAIATHGIVIGNDVEFTSVGTDSRAITQGQLFVALKGDHFDGHDYVAQSLAQGAAAALIENNENAPAVKVKDARLALGDLAAYWRKKINAPIVAITGSNGKTTVKEMLAAILKVAAGSDSKVLATQGNLNNDIGMPLTLLRADSHHSYVVLEMGMNHSGEISYLTNIAKPNFALVNNAGLAHVGELGSVEAIAQAKGEIFQGLALDGTAIINADDVYSDLWKSLASKYQQITFGLEATADVTASYELNGSTSHVSLKAPNGEVEFTLPASGLHNVKNALAASTAAIALNVSLQSIAEGLSGFSGAKGRLQQKQGQFDAQVIDDTYNANPASMKAAVDVLSAREGKRFMVMGDMGELGADAGLMHAEIGSYAKQSGIDALFVLGDLSQEAVKAFGSGAQHFENAESLSEAVLNRMDKVTTVLVKGSRFMRMERVVDKITKNSHEETY
ncbi:MAG: UDP-N-acetylmuramoyl-tripeptide:D-alanyl-D-alanine ligase [Pseudomonadota bacterium]|jgi:UDP-N-acetylmuramoyl-tripeptide--D-alanyl-D-alanine ligase